MDLFGSWNIESSSPIYHSGCFLPKSYIIDILGNTVNYYTLEFPIIVYYFHIQKKGRLIMKCYKFYFVNNNEDRELTPTMYAFTDNKELAKKFMEQRNPKLFRLIKTDMEKEVFEDFKHTYHMLVLSDILLRTKDEGSIKGWKTIVVVGTKREEYEVEKYIGDGEFIDKRAIKVNPKVFKKKYRKALKSIYYDTMHIMKMQFAGIPMPNTNVEKAHTRFKELKLDEFLIFYNKFGLTFRNTR